MWININPPVLNVKFYDPPCSLCEAIKAHMNYLGLDVESYS